MRLASLTKRLAALEPNQPIICPFCEYINLNDWPDERLQEMIEALDGKCATVSPELEEFLSGMPESSPSCPYCQGTVGMTEDEIDARSRWLAGILRDAA